MDEQTEHSKGMQRRRGREEPETSAETDAAWDLEIRGRIARYDGGEVRGVAASEVFAGLD